jgi:transcriptional regulator with XRE-family HTH domain
MRNRNLSEAFAVVLRKHRKAQNLSQETLAERADISSKMVSLIERGERNPTLDLANRLARGLGRQLSELVNEAERGQRNR